MKLTEYSCNLYDSYSYPDDYPIHSFISETINIYYEIRCIRNCAYEYRMKKIGYVYYED